MPRLIDADATIRDRNENGMPWRLGERESFRAVIDRQPTHTPWRRIDDVEGLTIEDLLIVNTPTGRAFGWFVKGKIILKTFHECEVAVTAGATHYMVIPEVPV